MTRRPSMSPLAMARAERRELRKLMARVSQVAEQRLREAIAEGLFDPLPTQTTPEASTGQILEGYIEGDTVIVDATPPRRTRTTWP
jgi:hypothetical protein